MKLFRPIEGFFHMKALFRQWIKNKKGNCDFLSQNSDLFLTIAHLHLTILTFSSE